MLSVLMHLHLGNYWIGIEFKMVSFTLAVHITSTESNLKVSFVFILLQLKYVIPA